VEPDAALRGPRPSATWLYARGESARGYVEGQQRRLMRWLPRTLGERSERTLPFMGLSYGGDLPLHDG